MSSASSSGNFKSGNSVPASSNLPKQTSYVYPPSTAEEDFRNRHYDDSAKTAAERLPNPQRHRPKRSDTTGPSHSNPAGPIPSWAHPSHPSHPFPPTINPPFGAQTTVVTGDIASSYHTEPTYAANDTYSPPSRNPTDGTSTNEQNKYMLGRSPANFNTPPMMGIGTSMSALVSPVPKITAKNSTSYESRWSSKETHTPSLQSPSDPLHYVASSLDMQPQAQKPRGHGISKPQERREASEYDDQINYRSVSRDENPRPQREAKKGKLSGLKDKFLPRSEAEVRPFPRDDTRPQQMGGHSEFGRAVDPLYRPPAQIEAIQPQTVIGPGSGGQSFSYKEDASRHFPARPQGSSTFGSQASQIETTQPQMVIGAGSGGQRPSYQENTSRHFLARPQGSSTSGSQASQIETTQPQMVIGTGSGGQRPSYQENTSRHFPARPQGSSAFGSQASQIETIQPQMAIGASSGGQHSSYEQDSSHHFPPRHQGSSTSGNQPSQIENIQPQMVIGTGSGGQRPSYQENTSRHFAPRPQGSSNSGSQASQIETTQPQVAIGGGSGGQHFSYEQDSSRHFPPRPQDSLTSGSQASQIETIQPHKVISPGSGGQRPSYQENTSRHFAPRPQGSSTYGSQATGGVQSLVDNTRHLSISERREDARPTYLPSSTVDAYGNAREMPPRSSGQSFPYPAPSGPSLGTIQEGRNAMGLPITTAVKPGRPRLLPFKSDESMKWPLAKSIENHIPSFMSSNIMHGDAHTIQLWYPRPLLAGTDGQRHGVEVGDLAILEGSGEIRVLFNIFRSYEDNKANGARPPPKPYQHLEANWRDEYVRKGDIQKRMCYLSDNFKLNKRPNEMRYEITSKNPARSGAIIVLPHGAVRSGLRNEFFGRAVVKDYFRDHAPSWYHHLKDIRHIPNLENGTLLLVRETYHSRTWGIAAFESKHFVKDPMSATFYQPGPNPYEYLWHSQDNRLKTNVGPSRTEIEALHGREPPLNQSFAVVLSALHLDKNTWHTHFTRSSVNFSRTASLESKSSHGTSRISSARRWSSIRGSLKGKGKDTRTSHLDAEEDGDYELLVQET